LGGTPQSIWQLRLFSPKSGSQNPLSLQEPSATGGLLASGQEVKVTEEPGSDCSCPNRQSQ
jgi:hypothetical protein